MRKRIITIVSMILIVVIALSIKYIGEYNRYKRIMESLEINQIDLSDTSDGKYYGELDAGLVSVELEVIVKDHKITDIILLNHDNGKGESAEVIIDKVIEDQSLNVDTISGATNSSKAILKSIENALNK